MKTAEMNPLVSIGIGSEPNETPDSSALGSILVSRFINHSAVEGTVIALVDVIEEIRTAPAGRVELIRKIRDAYSGNGGGKAGKAAIRDLKAQLPAVAFGGTGTRRCVGKATGLIAIDLDELGGRLPKIRARLEDDPHVVAVFVSPSGDGLKALFCVPVPSGSESELRRLHRRSFKAVESYVFKKFDVPVDPAASDLLRLCYLTHDPDCSFNNEAVPIDVDLHFPIEDDDPDNRSEDPAAKDGSDPTIVNVKEEIVEALLQSIPSRPEYVIWLKISAAVRNSLNDNAKAIALLKAWSPEEHVGEYRILLESSSFSRIGFGTLFHHARKHGFAGVISKFFYVGPRGYYMESKGQYIPLPREEQLKRHLRFFGIDPESPDCPICTIQKQQGVSFVGEVAGHKQGLHEYNGEKFLVTKGPTIIQPRPEGGAFVRDFLMALLATVDVRQYFNFLAWLHRARSALIAGRRTQLPALVVAGQPGHGKSLLVEIVKRALGGRSAGAYKFMSGQTRFNSELVGAELLVVDDDAAASDHNSRARFAQFLKATLFAGSVSAEGKGTNAVECAPVQAAIIAVNSDPRHLRVLPELDHTLQDKIILLKTSPSPMPGGLAGKQHLIKERLQADLPGFLHEVDNFDDTEWIDPATGRLHCYWNEELVRLVSALSPEEQLLEIAYAELEFNHQLEIDGRVCRGWKGTAAQLLDALTRTNSNNAIAARGLNRWPAAYGTFLGVLADDGTGRVRQSGRTKKTRIQQYWISDPNPEEGEEAPDHFPGEVDEEENGSKELNKAPHSPHPLGDAMQPESNFKNIPKKREK